MAATAIGGETGLKGLDLESRQMVLDTIHQLEKRLLPKEKILEFDKQEIFPEDIIREMLGPEIGLQLLFIPEEYGGMGGGARDCCAVTFEMSKICLGIATGFFAIQLGTDPIMVGATEEQKERWLGAIAEGNCLVAYGVTEPGAGSNVASIATKAEPVNDDSGNVTGYILNGAKQFISNGGSADLVTILAKTPEGPTFFVVEKGMAGFAPGKSEEKHGIRSSNTSPLTLSDVFVPVDNLIGGVPGNGLKQANKVFGYTRLMVASMALGTVETALNIVIPYAKERIQFGEPLSAKQGYTNKLVVPHAVRLEAAKAYMWEIADRLDGEESDLQVEGAIAKLFATESANNAADDFMQALGGYGYISEFMVEKIKRDVKITCIYEGTSEIQQSIISMFRWKKTRKTKGEYFNSIASEMESLNESLPDAGCGFYGICAKAMNDIVFFVQNNRLTKAQHVMFSLSDMMAHVEVGASMARKAASEANGPDAEKYKAMSRIFANDVSQLVSRKIMEIVYGSGVATKSEAGEFLKTLSLDALSASWVNVIKDMDTVADILFERK